MLRKPTQVTLCDGLAVQLVRPTQIADILGSHVDNVVEVSEDAVLAGIPLSLRYQSPLVEVSSAAAIPTINLADGLLNGLTDKTLFS
ncbi:putative pyridoxal-5'-phosphate-dependent protein beta subunit [Colletotrichum higginsianum]|nr:putative pyridoxal-5'-phosphate-dependent protein beta subunit [Colletotrichum higginsianum]